MIHHGRHAWKFPFASFPYTALKALSILKKRKHSPLEQKEENKIFRLYQKWMKAAHHPYIHNTMLFTFHLFFSSFLSLFHHWFGAKSHIYFIFANKFHFSLTLIRFSCLHRTSHCHFHQQNITFIAIWYGYLRTFLFSVEKIFLFFLKKFQHFVVSSSKLISLLALDKSRKKRAFHWIWKTKISSAWWSGRAEFTSPP